MLTIIQSTIISKDRPPHEGASTTFRKQVIDMSIPRQIVAYDKLGFKELLRSIKIHVFGNKSMKFNKKMCEDFFSDSNNFTL